MRSRRNSSKTNTCTEPRCAIKIRSRARGNGLRRALDGNVLGSDIFEVPLCVDQQIGVARAPDGPLAPANPVLPDDRCQLATLADALGAGGRGWGRTSSWGGVPSPRRLVAHACGGGRGRELFDTNQPRVSVKAQRWQALQVRPHARARVQLLGADAVDQVARRGHWATN